MNGGTLDVDRTEGSRTAVLVCQARAFAHGRLAPEARALRRLSRQPDPMAHEPWRSAWTPAAMRELLTGGDYAVAGDTDLLTLAGTLDMPVRGRASRHRRSRGGAPHTRPRRP
ncbi:hypothetical protein GCM10010187_72390 [Actinomadura coerulea]|nr:hypothetical protein GCM10010187_72390 [Actinomadura coerulea]